MTTLMLLALVLGGCNVDETGFEDPDVTGLETDGLDDASVEPGNDPPDAPEGQAANDKVVYSSLMPLTETPQPVTVIGLPGALVSTDVGVLVRVAPDGPEVEASVFGFGFTAVLDASLDDTLLVTTEDGAPIANVDLFDALDDEAGFGAGGGEAVIATPAGDLDTDVMEDDQRVAEVAVGDGMLDFIAAPYVVWNADTGASVLVEVDDRTATIAADAGEELCFASWDGAGAGLASCTVVP
jgi:hypothetical protein